MKVKFYEAAIGGNVNRLQELMKKGGLSTYDNELIALFAAAFGGQIQVIKYLVSQRLKLDHKDNEGHTALFCANPKVKRYLKTASINNNNYLSSNMSNNNFKNKKISPIQLNNRMSIDFITTPLSNADSYTSARLKNDSQVKDKKIDEKDTVTKDQNSIILNLSQDPKNKDQELVLDPLTVLSNIAAEKFEIATRFQDKEGKRINVDKNNINNNNKSLRR